MVVGFLWHCLALMSKVNKVYQVSLWVRKRSNVLWCQVFFKALRVDFDLPPSQMIRNKVKSLMTNGQPWTLRLRTTTSSWIFRKMFYARKQPKFSKTCANGVMENYLGILNNVSKQCDVDDRACAISTEFLPRTIENNKAKILRYVFRPVRIQKPHANFRTIWPVFLSTYFQ